MSENENPDIKMFYSKVVGVSHRNSNRTSRQKIIKEDVFMADVLTLKREPDNKVDPNAVAVYVEGLDNKLKQIGYLNRDIAEEVASHMDHGMFAGAIVTELTGGTSDKQFQGVNIQIVLAENPVDIKTVTGVKGKGLLEALIGGLFGKRN